MERRRAHPVLRVHGSASAFPEQRGDDSGVAVARRDHDLASRKGRGGLIEHHRGLTGTRPSERHRVRAKQVVLATGAFERPLVFAHNDIPGAMSACSVSTYINRYGVLPGNKLVLVTTNDSAYQTALDWHQAVV